MTRIVYFRGTIPATAELKFLDKVKWLDMYGVDLHPVLVNILREKSLAFIYNGLPIGDLLSIRSFFIIRCVCMPVV